MLNIQSIYQGSFKEDWMKRWNVIKVSECRVCGAELTEENWYPSHQKGSNHICKNCNVHKTKRWRKANQDKAIAQSERGNRRQGRHPFDKNKDCPSFLGVHIAEHVLSHAFKNVKRMPINHPGYDVVCNKDKRIDIKSSCTLSRLVDGIQYSRWLFTINYNTTADYFLCLAFDNRDDLTPLHAWLLPGRKFNYLKTTSISPSTIHKWDTYRLDISKISDCCDAMR